MVKRANQRRRKQSRKIDILCRDFLWAQKDLIDRLETIAFCADLCRSLLGMTDRRQIFCKACKKLKLELDDPHIVIFLKVEGKFQTHIFESCRHKEITAAAVEDLFGDRLLEKVASSTRLWSQQELLQANLPQLKGSDPVFPPEAEPQHNFSIHATGLGQSDPEGLILLCTPASNPPSTQQLAKLTITAQILAKALKASQPL